MKVKRPRIYVKRPAYTTTAQSNTNAYTTTVKTNTNVNKDENRNPQRDRNSARS